MGAWWRWFRARMTPARWAAFVALASAPVVVVLVLLLGIVLDAARPAAAVALVVAIVGLLAAVVVVVAIRRRLRRAHAVLDGESIALDGPSRSVLDADPVVAAWPRASRIAAGRALALGPGHVAAFGMATASPFARAQLAGLATSWRADWDDIARVVTEAPGAPEIDLALGRVDIPTLLLLARTVASAEPDSPAVDAVARYVARTPDVAGLPLAARHWLLERLVVAGDLEAAARVLGRHAATTHDRLVSIDVLNPFLPGSRTTDPGPWLAALSSLYRRAGLEGVALVEGPETPLDRLAAERPEPAGSAETPGPLVSILMTTYRPDGAALRTAVRAVLAQTWTDWELLVLDDGSPAEFDAVLDEVAGSDPRIRVIRSSDNAGPYVRRNEALLVARGDLVTMHDSDDWMHPRRLEAQVRHLEARPRLLANVCRSARVTPQLRFVQPRGTVLRLTESSLLFRRAEVLEAVGFFDSVRKGADTGFRLRLEAVMGRPVPIVDVEAPLILSRFDASSLSGADLRDGWTHPARVAYSGAHAHWLAERRSRGLAPRIDFPLVDRPFPAPAALLGRESAPVELDVVVVLDVRDDRRRAARARTIDADVAAAVAAGLRVGVRRLDAPTAGGIAPVARPSVQRMISAGLVEELLPGRDVTTRLVVVPEPSVLLAAPGGSDGLRAEQVVVAESSDLAPALLAECVAAATAFTGAIATVVSPAEARRTVERLRG